MGRSHNRAAPGTSCGTRPASCYWPGPSAEATPPALELLARFVAFTEAVARLRDTQQRAAQAAAAHRAAEQLRHCRLRYADAAMPAADGPAGL